MIVNLFVLGHIIGDFYLQTDETAVKKKESVSALLKHCIYYAIVLTIFAAAPLMTEELVRFAIFIITVCVLHGIIDSIRILIEKGKKFNSKYTIHLFAIDQILHIGIIILGCKIFHLIGGEYIYIFNTGYEVKSFNNTMNMIIGLLICVRPASILVKLLFSTIFSNGENNNKMDSESYKENTKVGSYIGVLERAIIFFLGMIGQFGAIGFVLTAKSIARYKQLEDKKFAEKYLVGTLFSAMIAIACIGLYNKFKI